MIAIFLKNKLHVQEVSLFCCSLGKVFVHSTPLFLQNPLPNLALIDTRESEDLEIFQNCMIELHCEQLKRDIDSFSASMEQDAGRKGGQKTEKVDRKGGQKTKNRSAVSKHMKQMLIRRIGPDKGGHWEVCIENLK